MSQSVPDRVINERERRAQYKPGFSVIYGKISVCTRGGGDAGNRQRSLTPPQPQDRLDAVSPPPPCPAQARRSAHGKVNQMNMSSSCFGALKQQPAGSFSGSDPNRSESQRQTLPTPGDTPPMIIDAGALPAVSETAAVLSFPECCGHGDRIRPEVGGVFSLVLLTT